MNVLRSRAEIRFRTACWFVFGLVLVAFARDEEELWDTSGDSWPGRVEHPLVTLNRALQDWVEARR